MYNRRESVTTDMIDFLVVKVKSIKMKIIYTHPWVTSLF